MNYKAEIVPLQELMSTWTSWLLICLSPDSQDISMHKCSLYIQCLVSYSAAVTPACFVVKKMRLSDKGLHFKMNMSYIVPDGPCSDINMVLRTFIRFM